MKQITANVLAMYLGCKVQTIHRHYPDPTKKSVRKIGTVMDIDLVLDKVGVWFPEEQKENLVNFEYHEVKPILRRLTDITEVEKKELGWLERPPLTWLPGEFVKLLSMSFDIFGLIDSGLAIDAATLKKTEA